VTTALIGLLAAVAVMVATPPAGRTFAVVSFPVQTLMSVLVPFFGVLLASDLHRSRHAAKVTPMLLGSDGGRRLALFGVLVCTIALAAFHPTRRTGGSTPGPSWWAASWCRWSHNPSAPGWGCCCGLPSWR
jgi:hypothetical protein